MTVSASRSATSSQPIFSGIPDMCHSGRRKLPLLTGAVVPAFSHHAPDETLERPSWFAPGIALHSRPARGTPRRERRGDPAAGEGDRALARWEGRPFHHAELVIGPATSGRIRWHSSPPPRCGEERKFVLAARFFASELWLTTNCQATKQIGASGGSCFVLEPPLIDSLPARMIPKSGLPVFGRNHAQEKEAERRQTQGCACPHASGVRDAPRRKAACAALRLRARSPADVPLAVLASGTFVPKAQRRARLPGSGAKAAACRTRRLGHSDATRAPVVVWRVANAP